MSTITRNVHSSLDPRENRDQKERKEQKGNQEIWAIEVNQVIKA